jgi:hypothetical protein
VNGNTIGLPHYAKQVAVLHVQSRVLIKGKRADGGVQRLASALD